MITEGRITSQDGLQLYTRTWEPEGDPSGAVCLVHGLGEHSGRYDHLGDFLNRGGYSLAGFDLRGHGRSQGSRGHADSIQDLMGDIEMLLAATAARYPGLPLFLYGHSLGGLLAINYTLRCRPRVHGVVITSPGLRTALEQQKLKVAAVQFGGSLLPRLALPSGLDCSGLSHDPRVIDAYRQDPLVHDQVTLRMGQVLLEAIEYAFAHGGEFAPPLLMMHGAQDPLAYPRGSQEFAGLVPGEVTVRLWEGCYHELHNEPQQAEVFEALLAWLDAHRGG